MGSVSIDWSTIIGAAALALLSSFSAGTRAIAWLRANRKVTRIIFDVLEHLAGLNDEGAKSVKAAVGTATKQVGGAVLAAADALAASAEKRNGGPGSATERKTTTSRGAKILQEVARWIPVLGAFR